MKTKLHYFLPLLFAFVATWVQAQVNFTMEQKRISKDEIELVFKGKLQPGWHVYGTNIPAGGPTATTFNVDKKEGVQLLGTLQGGKGLISKYDKVFEMNVSYYVNAVTFVQRIKLLKKNYTLNGYLQYGACNDESCLPPSTVEVKLSGNNGPDQSTVVNTEDKSQRAESTSTKEVKADTVAKHESLSTDSSKENLKVTKQVSDTAQLSKWYKPVIDQLHQYGENTLSTSLWHIFILGLIGGFLALLTPCVWPIIPMTVSFFLHRTDNRKKAIKDAVIYGVSIVVIYVGLGILITSVYGPSALNELSTKAVPNIIFFLMLVIFGASFLGGFELTLPSSWTNKVDSKATEASGLVSIFLMAFTLALVSFSCTGPIIGFLLVEVSTGVGSAVAPTIGMFGFALALALPFTLFALFPSMLKKVPRSGGWMNTIKVVLGFIELAFSLKFLSVADRAYDWHILDREVFLSLWIVLFFMLAAYLFGWIRFPHDEDEEGHIGIPRFMLGVLSFAFSIYMLPGLWGAPLKSVSAFSPPISTQDFNLNPVKIEAQFKDYDAGMAYALRVGKPVLLDFTGNGCVNCRKMETAVWHDPTVRDLLTKDYVLISLYVDDKEKLPEPIEVEENGEKRILRTVGDRWSYLQRRKFGANSQPFYVPVDNQGNVLNHSFAYKEDIKGYINFLKTGLENYRKNNTKK